VDLYRPQHEQRLQYFRSLIGKLADDEPFMAHVAELVWPYEGDARLVDTIPQQQERQQANRDLRLSRRPGGFPAADSASLESQLRFASSTCRWWVRNSR